MKKRVRVYKAQTGMQVPGSMQQQQPSDEDLVKLSVYLMDNNDMSAQDVINYFISNGYSKDYIEPLITGLADNIASRKLAKEAQERGDETTLNRIDQEEATDSAFADAADKRAREEMYYSNYSQDPNLETDYFQQNILGAKFGAEIPSKKTFLRRFIKKAEEGMQMPDQKADSTDTGERRAGIQMFVDTIQSTADRAKLLEEGKELYDLITNSYGRGGQNRAAEQAALLASALGANPYLPPLEKLQVQKTRMFSQAPKAWTAEFGKRPVIEPQPQSQSIYTNTVSNPARKQNEISLEEVDKMVNQDNKKEAANQKTVQNQATATRSSSGVATRTNRDQWGRSPDNDWYGFNPDTKQWEEGPKAAKSSTRPMPSLMDFAYATGEQYKKANSPIKYNVYVNENGNVTGEKAFIDPNREYTYDPISKKWFRGNSSKPISDKNAIANLNKWKSKGLLVESMDDLPTTSLSWQQSQELINRMKSQPQAAMADDELIQQLFLFGVSPSNVQSLPQFMFKPFLKGYLNSGTKGLPQNTGLNPGQGMLNPGQGMLNPGQGMLNPGQKFLGPGMGYQMGGFADSSNPGLYKFIYGGDDDGKLTDSPFFEDGGLVKAQAGRWQKKADGSGEYEWVEGVTPEMEREARLANNLSWTRPKSYEEYQPKFGWERSSMSPEELAYEKEYLENYSYPRAGYPGLTVDQVNAGYYPTGWGDYTNVPGYGEGRNLFPYNNPYIGNQYMGYGYNPYGMNYGMRQYRVKQKGLPIELATGNRYMGDFMGADLSKLTAKGVRRSGIPRRLEAEFYVDDWDPKGTAGTQTTNTEVSDTFEPRTRSTRRKNKILSDEEEYMNWLRSGPKPFTPAPIVREDYNPEDVKSYMKKSLTLPPRTATTSSETEPIPAGFPILTSGPINTEMAYGGYLPKAQMYNSQIGVDPIELDSRFVPNTELSFVPPPISDVNWAEELPIPEDMEEETPEIDTRSEWDPSRIMTKEQAEKEGVEWFDPGPKIDYGKKKVKVKYKTKPKLTNQEIQGSLKATNALIDMGLNVLGERGGRDKNRRRAERYTSDALMGSVGAYDKGNTVVDSGLIRPNQMGFTGVSKYGGATYQVGGETYMSEAQIRKFLEEGGELEFI